MNSKVSIYKRKIKTNLMLSIEELTLPAVLYNKVVLKNVANFIAKHLQHFFIIKLLTLTCDLRLHRCCNVVKFFKEVIFIKHVWVTASKIDITLIKSNQ